MPSAMEDAMNKLDGVHPDELAAFKPATMSEEIAFQTYAEARTPEGAWARKFIMEYWLGRAIPKQTASGDNLLADRMKNRFRGESA